MTGNTESQTVEEVIEKLVTVEKDLLGGNFSIGRVLAHVREAVGQLSVELSERSQQPPKTQTTSVGTQTVTEGEVKKEIETRDIWCQIDRADVKVFEELVNKKWPKAAYRRTKVIRRSLLNTEGPRIALVDRKDDHCKRLLQGLATQQPSISLLLQREPESGRLAVIESSDQAILDDENNTDLSSAMRHLIIGFTNKREGNDVDIIKLLQKARLKFEPMMVKDITITACNIVDTEKLRKMVECAFVDTNMLIKVCSVKKPSEVGQRQRRPFKLEGDTILIRGQKGETFAEVVSKLKAGVKPGDMGIKVKKITKTNKGEVKMTIKEGSEEAKRALVSEIRLKTETEVDVLKHDLIPIIITQIDETVTESEVQKVLEEALSAESDTIKVGPLRRAWGGTLSTTLRLPFKVARKAIDLRNIQIGWTMAKIKEKIIPDWCSNCQTFGHRTQLCGAPKYGKQPCRRCGEEGHVARLCTKPPKCFVCEGVEKDHRADSMACPIYRRAVQDARKRVRIQREMGPAGDRRNLVRTNGTTNNDEH